MRIPAPSPGLVIGYSYLWSTDRAAGQEEGLKDRPCAIILVRRRFEFATAVSVVPITHRRPDIPEHAISIPMAIKSSLGLDPYPSWIVVSEVNHFLWPGPDLRPVPGAEPKRIAYGSLPPTFFRSVRDRLLDVHRNHQLRSIPRSE